ncbi:hypothetical protein G6F57_004414 [Rhizopus arrhizus]|uniref:Uncharacterized protein n=1 Tax=Rhizopus oryzae TaxID=64495 RepID=A0A9P6X840_RHIOR|nr:hypothetical protein G6F23_006840 [Rhizopus arrhizus]KAG1397318.1 hypothetical protein G6F58_011551 [Rhizopus delemar]KAG0762486.1 hypothetical protein G6F24_006769 [Rhizopus arrhizus]KAG0780014.1 hypothetical protein G6F22_010314 [Rhizopus arrhizus]KAG0788935.1 hypothetical protein G6F21_006859 [Rhizopus arrhizus]
MSLTNPFKGLKKKSGKEKSPTNSKKAAKVKRNKRKEEVLHTSTTPQEQDLNISVTSLTELYYHYNNDKDLYAVTPSAITTAPFISAVTIPTIKGSNDQEKKTPKVVQQKKDKQLV